VSRRERELSLFQ